MKTTPFTGSRQDIPEVSLRRLPVYYRSLQAMAASGVSQVSCAELGRKLGLDATQVRKDIEMTGIVGRPRVGYSLHELVLWIENFLGWNRPKEAILAGAGSLGSALLGYKEFRAHGMEIAAVFDISAKKVGRTIHERQVQHISELPAFVSRKKPPLGLITTPAAAAQNVADLMVESGILAIWNFAPVHLHVPDSVLLQDEDLYFSLASLSFKLDRGLAKANRKRAVYDEKN